MCLNAIRQHVCNYGLCLLLVLIVKLNCVTSDLCSFKCLKNVFTDT